MTKNIEIVQMAVQQVAVIFDRLQKAINKLKLGLNLIEGELVIINFYQCQHIITKTDMNNKL